MLFRSIISYEDENGEVTEVEKELTLFVSEPMEDFGEMMDGMEGMEGMDMETSGGLAGWMADPVRKILALTAAVLLLAAIGAGIAIATKRKKKREQEEEDMDDEIS